MHVVFVSHEYPPYIFGGIGTFVESLARELGRMGVTTTVICGYPKPSPPKQKNMGDMEDEAVKITRLPYLNVPLSRHTMFQVFNLRRIRDIVRDTKADVVHGQAGSIFPSTIVIRSLAPVVVTFHGSAKANKANASRSLTRGGSWGDFWTSLVGYPAWNYIYQKELQHADAAVAVSSSLQSDILRETGGEYREKLCTIRSGVDINQLDRRYGRFEDTLENHDTVLFAGRLVWAKGALDLVRIGALLGEKRMKLIIHGTGPLLGRVRRNVKELALESVEIKDFSYDEMMKSMRRSSFVVLPSRYEACPMAILEAMCLGKIPVMYNLPYARELTENGEYGVLATDPNDMVTKINGLLEAGDVELVQSKIRAHSREQFDGERTARGYLRLYEELSGRK